MLAACSSVQTTGNVPRANFQTAAPFGVVVNASDPQLQALLREYVDVEFGRSLDITDNTPGRGTIEITYTAATDANGFAAWQNSTTLVVIRGPQRERLWTGEYDYKGGMELSGFAVNSAAEAAKLSVQRLAKKFNAEAVQ
jgi:hypothetical protein